ncbi:MAG: DUF1566 domain-containing protein [Patescibacteria group bacterium]
MLLPHLGYATSQCGDKASVTTNPYPCCDNNFNNTNDSCDGNCTWWVWNKAYENWNQELPRWGNAQDWAQKAELAEVNRHLVSYKPAPNTIACRYVNGQKQYGHVAWVEDVSQDGLRVTVTEMNCFELFNQCKGCSGDCSVCCKNCRSCENLGSVRRVTYDTEYFTSNSQGAFIYRDPPNFMIGSKVKTVVSLRIRANPSLKGRSIAKVSEGSTGIIINNPNGDNPQTGDGFVWWYIQFEDGVEGLSVQRGIELITQSDNFGAIKLPKTGQTKCYDPSGIEINCIGTGQDGDIQAGVPWPDPRFTITYCDTTGPCPDQNSDCDENASSDIITDNLTGLIWVRDGNLPNGQINWYEALDYANNLILCGYSDWHLPNINELESLVNAGESDIATWLNIEGFNNVQADYYWASTFNPTGSVAWVVNMQIGYVGALGDNNFLRYVLLSRGGQFSSPLYPSNIWRTGQQIIYAPGDDGDLKIGIPWPDPRFTDHGDWTVTDNLTGLMWTKDAYAPGPSSCNPNTNKTWQEALDHIRCFNENNYLGHNDWHLPNRKEMRSLIDYSNSNPGLPFGHPFIHVQPFYYWTSTTAFYFPPAAWFSGSGNVSSDWKHYDYWYNAWPIRGGQTSPFVLTVTPIIGNVMYGQATKSSKSIIHVEPDAGFSESIDLAVVNITSSLSCPFMSSFQYEFAPDTTIDPSEYSLDTNTVRVKIPAGMTGAYKDACEGVYTFTLRGTSSSGAYSDIDIQMNLQVIDPDWSEF